MNDTTPEILETAADGVTTLTLNRPERLNPLSESMIAALQGALDRVAVDTSVRVVVLTGAGRAFCAGHDSEGDACPPGPRDSRRPSSSGAAA